MSICNSGIENKVFGANLTVNITDCHPLLKLANLIPWQELFDFIIPDLKNTTQKGKWWLGRKLKVRIHLAIYILQQMFNKTDRQMEYDLKDNVAYRIFCGAMIVKNWHIPDHTKLEEFRSRLSPETQRKISNHIAVVATKEGFANPGDCDIDSTVQEANMTYPSKAKALTKIAILAKKIANHMDTTMDDFHCRLIGSFTVELKKIKSIYRDYVFNARKRSDSENKYKLKELFQAVVHPLCAAKRVCKKLNHPSRNLPWNIKRATQQLLDVGVDYFDTLFKQLYSRWREIGY